MARVTRRAVRSALLLAFVSAVSPARGQEETQPPSRAIDVLAADSRGRIVDSLRAADFTVYQNGSPQPVASAEFVHDPSRAVGIFLDEFHAAPGPSFDRARDALLTLVQTHLTAEDRIAVFKPLDSLLSIQWVDRAAAVRAIEHFAARQADYEPRSDFERNYMAGTPARIEAARNQIAISALHALATHLGTAPQARKTLIVVTAGVTQSGRSRAEAPLPTIESVVRVANRNRVSIYPLDLSQATDAGSPAREVLRTLAEQTVGRLVPASGALDAGLAEVLADASGYYVVTVPPSAGELTDRFQPVEIRTSRKGVTLRGRSGFWAGERKTVSSPQVVRQSGLRARTPTRISPLVRPWFGMAPGRDGSTQVSFVWEPAPRVPGERSRVSAPARVALTVAREDTGETIFEGAVLPSTGASDPVEAAETRATFELSPGKLQVSMSIQDAASRQLDTDVRQVVVGGFPGRLTLGTLQVLRARTAREFRAVAASPAATPVVTRQFSRSERLLVRVPADAGGGTPKVTARLVNRFGAARDLTIDPWPESKGYQIDVPLAGLAAGEYVVEVAATNEDGTASDSVAFRVTP